MKVNRVISFIVFLFILLGCGNVDVNKQADGEAGKKISNSEKETVDEKDIFPGFGYLPKGFSNQRIQLVNTPKRQQQCFTNDNLRIVFEKTSLSSEVTDEMKFIKDYDSVILDEKTIVESYVYKDNAQYDSVYGDDARYLTEYNQDPTLVPVKGDIEIRWNDDNYQYHIFGNIEEVEELILIAQSLITEKIVS